MGQVYFMYQITNLLYLYVFTLFFCFIVDLESDQAEIGVGPVLHHPTGIAMAAGLYPVGLVAKQQQRGQI